MENLRGVTSPPLCTQRLAGLESLGDRRPWHSSVLGPLQPGVHMVKGSSHDSTMGRLHHPILVTSVAERKCKPARLLCWRQIADRAAAWRRVAVVSLLFTLANEGLIVCYHQQLSLFQRGAQTGWLPHKQTQDKSSSAAVCWGGALGLAGGWGREMRHRRKELSKASISRPATLGSSCRT